MRILPVVGVCLSLSLLALGCDKKSEMGGTYTVRGQINTLSTAGPGEVQIHHEAVPDFVNRDGRKVGMESMSMPFGVIKGVGLTGLAPGDKVQFTFEVHWNARPTTQITRIDKLPPDTALTLTGL